MTNLQQIDRDGQCVQGLAEYIWLKGSSLKSRTRVIEVYETEEGDWNPQLPWLAAPNGDQEDTILSPAHYIDDPIRGDQCYLVLCEVRDADGRNHETNTRAQLRGTLDGGASELVPHWNFDQRFLLKCDSPGKGREFKGREIFEMFIQACLQSGLLFGGGRTHKMSGAWAFQMGIRDFDPGDDPSSDPRWSMRAGDHLIFARWILKRLFEDEDVFVTFNPVGFTGVLTAEFSTEMMRHKANGKYIGQAVAETFQEGGGADLHQISTSVPLRTIGLGHGPIRISVSPELDPYAFMNHVLLRVSGMDQQHLADEDQVRYQNMGLSVIQGGAGQEPLPPE